MNEYYLDYLKRYQAWRTGKDERTMEEADLSPAETTKAIDWAIKELSKCEIVKQFEDVK